jgi:hypothetical protein
VYEVPKIEGAVFLATFEDDVFSTGQFVKSGASKYAGQNWDTRTYESEGGIVGDQVCRVDWLGRVALPSEDTLVVAFLRVWWPFFRPSTTGLRVCSKSR